MSITEKNEQLFQQLTGQQVADRILTNREIVTELGYHALLNGEAMDADLPFLTRFANAVFSSIPPAEPVPMILHCPKCGLQHIDAPEVLPMSRQVCGLDNMRPLEWTNPPHRSHLCHGCGHVWRPADVPTEGVAAIQTRGSNDSAVQPANEGVQSLLRKPISASNPLPPGCYCQPGRCAAPQPNWCRDHAKRDGAVPPAEADMPHQSVTEECGGEIGAGHFRFDGASAWVQVPKQFRHEPGVVVLYHAKGWPLKGGA